MQTAIVDGIERQGFSWISIQCQCCKANYNGGNGSTKPGPIVAGYKAYEDETIRRDARALGWTGPMTRNSDIDLCPDCSKKAFGEGNTLTVVPRMEPVKITQWFKPGDHPEVEFSFGNAFIEMILADGSRDHKYITPGQYIVETNTVRVVMTPEQVAESFVLPSDSNVFK